MSRRDRAGVGRRNTMIPLVAGTCVICERFTRRLALSRRRPGPPPPPPPRLARLNYVNPFLSRFHRQWHRRGFTWKVKRFPRIINAKINATRRPTFGQFRNWDIASPTSRRRAILTSKDNERSRGLVIFNVKRARPIRGFTIQVFDTYARNVKRIRLGIQFHRASTCRVEYFIGERMRDSLSRFIASLYYSPTRPVRVATVYVG